VLNICQLDTGECGTEEKPYTEDVYPLMKEIYKANTTLSLNDTLGIQTHVYQ